MNFLDKLDFLMSEFGLNKNALAKSSGIPYTTIQGFYEKGYRNSKLSTIEKLAMFFGVSLDYLMRDEITDSSYGKTYGFKISASEMELVKKHRALDDFGRDAVDWFIAHELQRKEMIDTQMPEQQTRLLAYAGRIAAAGSPVNSFGAALNGTIEVMDTPESRIADFAIGVSGDSMNPELFDGDTLLVKKVTELALGKIGIFEYQNEIYVKQLKENGLHSLNSRYDDIIPCENVQVIGEVIGKAELKKGGVFID